MRIKQLPPVAHLAEEWNLLGYLGIRAFAVTHSVLQLRRELLNEVRSILAVLTAIKQNSL